jgi:hypothetical protein
MGTSPRATSRRFASRKVKHRVALPRAHRAADAYVVRRNGKTVIAGYPGSPTGDATLIALRGSVSRRAGSTTRDPPRMERAVSEGMLPNCFPDLVRRRSSTRSTPLCLVAVHSS